MTIHTDLSTLLRQTLEERCKRNPRYSLRAFARDLGVPAPRLSRWLKNEDGLSSSSAQQLAKRLGFSVQETDAFVTAMEATYARAKNIREIAKQKLESISIQHQPLDIEAFKVIADWYNLAVMSLIETEGFKSDSQAISKRLGVSVYEASGAVERLLKLEMIEKTADGYRPTGVFFANPAGVPSKSIRAFHAQVLEKAKTALEMQNVDERDFSTFFYGVDPSQIDEARAVIKKFRDEFQARFCNKQTRKKEVYALGIQFFRVTEKTPKES